MSIDGIKVRVFGDVAVVTYDQSEKSQFQGKDTSEKSLWTDIFVKRNGKWQIAANHGSRVDEPKNDAARRSRTTKRPNNVAAAKPRAAGMQVRKGQLARLAAER